MMLADVGIAVMVMVMMKLVTNDASFISLQAGHGGLYSLQPAHNDESDSRERKELICLRCTIAQQRRKQTGVSGCLT